MYEDIKAHYLITFKEDLTLPDEKIGLVVQTLSCGNPVVAMRKTPEILSMLHGMSVDGEIETFSNFMKKSLGESDIPWDTIEEEYRLKYHMGIFPPVCSEHIKNQIALNLGSITSKDSVLEHMDIVIEYINHCVIDLVAQCGDAIITKREVYQAYYNLFGTELNVPEDVFNGVVCSEMLNNTNNPISERLKEDTIVLWCLWFNNYMQGREVINEPHGRDAGTPQPTLIFPNGLLYTNAIVSAIRGELGVLALCDDTRVMDILRDLDLVKYVDSDNRSINIPKASKVVYKILGDDHELDTAWNSFRTVVLKDV